MTVGVARQYAGITGQVETCQTVVFAAYVTGCAHALSDFRLYLPKSWCADRARRKQARVPDEVEFATKPALGTAMITGAASAGVPFAWVAADEVYGRSSKLRQASEKDVKGYVFAVPVNFTVTLSSGRKSTVAAVARLIPATAWETRSCGRGCKGHRSYAWAWAATASPRHWVLTRRSQSDSSDLAFFYCHVPEGRPVSLPHPDLAGREEMAGRGMPAAGKGTGLPGPAPGPAVALLPPAHRAVDVRPGAAGRRRRPPITARREPFAQHRRQAARGLARHREAARQSRRSASRWRPRPSQGQRPRSPSARLPGHSADELCRPRPGLRLVTMAPTPSGPGRWHHYHARLKAARVT